MRVLKLNLKTITFIFACETKPSCEYDAADAGAAAASVASPLEASLYATVQTVAQIIKSAPKLPGCPAAWLAVWLGGSVGSVLEEGTFKSEKHIFALL